MLGFSVLWSCGLCVVLFPGLLVRSRSEQWQDGGLNASCLYIDIGEKSLVNFCEFLCL